MISEWTDVMNTIRTLHVNTIPPENLSVQGRVTHNKKGITFFWTGSVLEFVVSGNELALEIEVPEDDHVLCPWVCLYLNGHLIQRVLLKRGRQLLPVYDHLNYPDAKTIRLVKDSPALLQNALYEGETLYSVCSIRTDGELSPVPPGKMKIELIGDSITSGEGLFGYPGLITEDLWFFTAQNGLHYGTTIAHALNADLRMVTQAGWGVYIGYTNNPSYNIPSIYERVCGVQTSSSALARGSSQAYDFSQWQPDLIIVNLGTNDAAAFANPGYTDPETGCYYKMRKAEDGTLFADDLEKIKEGVLAFLSVLRKHNPHAHILWCYGMMGHEIEETLRDAIRLSGDPGISYVSLPDTLPGEFGSVDHPGIPSHKKTAGILLPAVKALGF